MQIAIPWPRHVKLKFVPPSTVAVMEPQIAHQTFATATAARHVQVIVNVTFFQKNVLAEPVPQSHAVLMGPRTVLIAIFVTQLISALLVVVMQIAIPWPRHVKLKFVPPSTVAPMELLSAHQTFVTPTFAKFAQVMLIVIPWLRHAKAMEFVLLSTVVQMEPQIARQTFATAIAANHAQAIVSVTNSLKNVLAEHVLQLTVALVVLQIVPIAIFVTQPVRRAPLVVVLPGPWTAQS
jgi:hypothetical protein